MLKNLLVPVLLVALFTSCNRENPSVFVKSVNDPKGEYFNRHEFAEPNLKLEVVYKPAEYNALMQIDPRGEYETQYQEVLASEEQSLRFDFRISALEGSYDVLKDTLLPADYTARIEYLSGQLSNDLYLKTGDDSMPCSFFHFERTYNAIPYNNFLLGFELTREDLEDDVEIIYHDRVFGLGRVVFTFPKNLLTKSNTINL